MNDLRNALVRALETLRSRTGRALLIVDALGELVADDVNRAYDRRIEFLPPSLPEGVRVILTCRRDIPLRQALKSRLNRVEEREVDPLAFADSACCWSVASRLAVCHGLNLSYPSRPSSSAWPAIRSSSAARPMPSPMRSPRPTPPAARPGSWPPISDSTEAFFRSIYRRIGERQGTT